MPARTRRWLIIFTLFVWAAVLAVACTTAPPAREAVRTVRVLPAFFAGLPVQPEAWGREPPTVTVEPFPARDGTAALHTYRPPRGRHPALVVSLGVNPAPADDPRVVRLLSGLARAGLVAVLVQSQALDEDRISTDSPDLLVRAFEDVSGRPYVEPGRVGFVGFSVGAGLTGVAAADPRIRDRVRLLVSFGGYFNTEDLVFAATTSTIRLGDTLVPWQPDPLTRDVVTKNLTAPIAEPSQRDLVRVALAGETWPLSRLNAHARAVYDVLANTDPARAPDLYARLPAPQREGLRSVSPAATVTDLHARVFLMHDRADHLIPYVESRRFAAALRAAGNPPYASEFDIFEHVEPTGGGNPLRLATDLVRLLLHVQAVLTRLG